MLIDGDLTENKIKSAALIILDVIVNAYVAVLPIPDIVIYPELSVFIGTVALVAPVVLILPDVINIKLSIDKLPKSYSDVHDNPLPKYTLSKNLYPEPVPLPPVTPEVFQVNEFLA